MNMLISIIVMGLSLSPYIHCDIFYDEPGGILIEKFIIEYLNAEKQLWTVLENRDPTAFDQMRIKNIHHWTVVVQPYDYVHKYRARNSIRGINWTTQACYRRFESKEIFFNQSETVYAFNISIKYFILSKATELYNVTSLESFWTETIKVSYVVLVLNMKFLLFNCTTIFTIHGPRFSWLCTGKLRYICDIFPRDIMKMIFKFL